MKSIARCCDIVACLSCFRNLDSIDGYKQFGGDKKTAQNAPERGNAQAIVAPWSFAFVGPMKTDFATGGGQPTSGNNAFVKAALYYVDHGKPTILQNAGKQRGPSLNCARYTTFRHQQNISAY